MAVLAAAPVYQGIYSDPAYQLKAVQQKLSGESWSINNRVHPDPHDLSKDSDEWISWWTPGTQLVVYPFMSAGLTLGKAVRAVAALSLIVGAVGWATWFSAFEMPVWMLFMLVAALPFVRYASNGLFLYSSETLVFAAGPWMLVATLPFLDKSRDARPGYMWHFALGIVLGLAYWLKDSLAFVAFGATAALAVDAWRRRDAHLAGGLARSVATAVGAAIPFITLVALNHRYGLLANKVAAGFAPKLPSGRTILDAVAVPALQMADAFAMWDYVLMHPSHPLVRNAIWISVIGVPGGVLLWWLFFRRAAVDAAGLLARTVLVCSLASIVTIWIISDAVDHKPRHVATAAFAILPLVVSEGRRRWRRLSMTGRVVLLAGAAAYLCVPMAYGLVSVGAKVIRFPRNYRPGPAGIYNPLLAQTDLAGVRERLLSRTAAAEIWYVPDSISALDLPGRLITTEADFQPLAELEAARYKTSRPLQLRALLIEKFAHDGKGDAIRASFPQAGPWQKEIVPGSDYQLWTSDLKEH
ncbi:MAG TPA: hypothetical protein VFP91_01930 [Vicinamibacterales bacterium]|nr:hypothetical protein [Vicinamibacterales bacterium]